MHRCGIDARHTIKLSHDIGDIGNAESTAENPTDWSLGNKDRDQEKGDEEHDPEIEMQDLQGRLHWFYNRRYANDACDIE